MNQKVLLEDYGEINNMNRGERRRRNKIIYNRRAKLFFKTLFSMIPCNLEDIPIHELSRVKINHRFWREAETWKELQKFNPTIHLFKNTRTIWNRGLWSKYDKHIKNKKIRREGKNEIRNYDQDNF